MWAITDFTKENGATQVVPGSHKWDKERMPLDEEIENAEMSAGSVFIYTGSVMHGGGANQTSENRLGVFCTMLQIGLDKKKINIYPALLQ